MDHKEIMEHHHSLDLQLPLREEVVVVDMIILTHLPEVDCLVDRVEAVDHLEVVVLEALPEVIQAVMD